jgi:hypothetical protein
MRCPVCKAENDQGPACRRCKADLALLWAVEARREALLISARQRLARRDGCPSAGDGDPVARLEAHIDRRQAVEEAAAATRLRAGPDAGRVAALARLLARDFAGAWRAYCAATGGAEDDSGRVRNGW